MTLQEIFNTAYLGLASQGFNRSVDAGACLYRHPNGRRCAAGWLIRDEDYKPELENMVAYNAKVQQALGFVYMSPGNMPETMQLISLLQRAHDDAISPLDMDRQLQALAYRFGLTVPELPAPKDWDHV